MASQFLHLIHKHKDTLYKGEKNTKNILDKYQWDQSYRSITMCNVIRLFRYKMHMTQVFSGEGTYTG